MLRFIRLGLPLWLACVARVAAAAELHVYFFDIGQGDSALIVSPTGKTVLIDSGPPEGGDHLRARLNELLKAPLDLAILSHPHLDHLGGMEKALSVKGAKLFMDSGFNHPSPAYNGLLHYLDNHGIQVVNATQGRKIDLGGGAVLTLLAPKQPFFSGTRSDPNANSVVAMLSYGQRHVLFTGDAEEETEKMLTANGGIRADVLKVPHHGSKHSSTGPFLDAVRPQIAVISVGEGNDYGHPRPEALQRLHDIGAKIYRTDEDGEVRVDTDGSALSVHTEHGGSAGSAEPAAPAPMPASAAKADEPKPHKITPKIIDAHPQAAAGYVGSTRAKVFHRAGCKGAEHIAEANRITWPTREAAIAQGREPAKDCNP